MRLRLLRPVLCGLLFMCAAAAQAALPSLEHFFGNSPFSGASLSPDGRSLAVRLSVDGKRDALAVVDLATSKITNVAGFSDADVGRFRWVNNQRLVLDTTERQAGAGTRRAGMGLFAVDRDGARFKQLASRYSNGRRVSGVLPWDTMMLGQAGAQSSDSIYVIAPASDRRSEHAELMSVDTLTGRTNKFSGPDNVRSWLLDQRGEPRVAVAFEKNLALFYHLDQGGEWRRISSYKLYTRDNDAFWPIAFGPDGTLYVEANAGQDKSALYPYDIKAGKLGSKPLIISTEYDFNGQLILGADRLLGARLLTDGESVVWFDEKMKAVQKLIDERMPTTINVVSVPRRAETPWVLVESYSDTQPRVFHLFDADTNTLTRLGDSRPGISAAQMGSQDMVSYPARDGLRIPAWLTMPPASQLSQLPMVVLVHGGPFTRGGSWGWEAQGQFLASRGYAVLAPEFRGSTGFGSAHFKAGWKQWGLGMQDDIADGVRWAIKQGIADPKRVCIMGAGFGGYAALMGLVRDPDLFQCAINYGGITDISLLQGSWNVAAAFSERFLDYGMPELIGDQVNDAAGLAAASPLAQAARVRKPLLLAYGEADRSVPIQHGRKFYAKVKPVNPDVEWVTYPAEAHRLLDPKNRIDYWRRVEKFLERHIGRQQRN